MAAIPAANISPRICFVTFFQLVAQCPYEQLSMDSGRDSDTGQRLAVASCEPMVAAAGNFGGWVSGHIGHHWLLPGKKSHAETAWETKG